MDPAASAAAATALLASFFAHAGGRLGEKVTSDLSAALTARLEDLYTWVTTQVVGDRRAHTALQQVERTPSDPSAQRTLTEALAELAGTDEAVAAMLARLVDDAQQVERSSQVLSSDAGIVAPQADVRLHGTYVAGRDLTIGVGRPDERGPGGGG
jgi:hypothetical protein